MNENPTHHDAHSTSLGGPVKGLIGRTVGEFYIRGVVGQGSMGVVFEAEQIDLKRRVALKVLPPTLTHTDRVIKRFLREAESVAKLNHENIVEIYGIGESNGLYFYAMRFIDGQSLDRRLRTGPVPPEEAARFALQTARAIDYSHRNGIIHRDIKPSNLIFSNENGRLVITDFGLARPERSSSLTESGALVGTPVYMSPEQVRANRGELDRRTDVYSMGATLYELLTGRPPFQGESTQQVLQAILDDEPKRLRKLRPNIPWELEVITLRAMEKLPEQRFQTAGLMADELERYLQGEPIHSRGSSIFRRATKRLRKHRKAAIAITTISLVSLVFLFAFGFFAADQAKKAKSSQLSELLTEGMALLASEEYGAAQAKYESILDDHAGNARARAGLGLSLYHLGLQSEGETSREQRDEKLRSALVHLETALNLGILDGTTRFAHGDILMKLAQNEQELEAGLAEIFLAADEDPDNFEVNLQVTEVAFTTLANLKDDGGNQETRQRILDFAVNTANRAVKLNSHSDDARVARAKVFMEVAQVGKESQSSVYLAGALEDVERAIVINSNNRAAFEMRKELQKLNRGGAVSGDWKFNLISQGIPLMADFDFGFDDSTDMNQLTDAMMDLMPPGWRLTPRSDEKQWDELVAEAKSLEQEGQDEEALSKFQEAIAIQESAELHWCMSRVQLRTSRRVEARESVKRACELNPADLDYLLSFYQLAEESGDPTILKEASEYFQVLFPNSDIKSLIEQLQSGEAGLPYSAF